MTSKSLITAAALLLSAQVHAVPAHPILDEVKDARYIVKSAQPTSTSRDPELCASTTLDERRMEFFVRHAVLSTGVNYSRALIQGDCTAEGFVIVNQRKAYRLTIDSASGWGVVQAGGHTTYLYCEKCEGLLEKTFDLKP